MGFCERDCMVRCEIFKDWHGGAGKWYTTIALDMEGEYDTPMTDVAILNALRRQLTIVMIGKRAIVEPGQDKIQFGGMWAVVLDPYHVHAHPMIVQVPTT